jgi:hypothetical protein
MKLRHASEKKEVTDYTAELYVACREAQTALEAKLTVINKSRKEAQDKLDAEEKARTDDRDQKMYSLGMTFNGQAFVGYGKAITKNSLHSLDNESFAGIVTELEGLKIEQDVTGEVKEAPVAAAQQQTIVGGSGSSFTVKPTNAPENTSHPVTQPKRFENQVYTCNAGDYSFHLTKGVVDFVTNQVIINERVMESAIYVQVIYNGV